MFWRVPRMWQGKTVVVLASGPSMNQRIADEVRYADVRCIVVNDTYRLAPWADLLYAADVQWWMQNPEAARFEGMRASVAAWPGVHMLRYSGLTGFDEDPGVLRTGGNSGYQAVHIAAHAGARRILLCGFDMTARHGSHWHGDHAGQLRNTEEERYVEWRKRFETLHESLLARGIEVVNCTPGSALKCFPAGDLELELATSAVPAA